MNDRRKLLEQLSKQHNRTGKINTAGLIDPNQIPFNQALDANDLTQQVLAHEVLKNTGVPIPNPGARASTVEDFYHRIMQERYPELKPNIDVVKDLAKNENARGVYYSGPSLKWIEMDQDLWKKNPESALGTLLHESGHQYDEQIMGRKEGKPINDKFRFPGMNPDDAYEIVAQGHHLENIPGQRGVGTFGKAALQNLKEKGTFRAETGPLGAMWETLKGIYGPEVEELAKANPEAQAKIAAAYEAMQHNPNDPAVAKAYQALTDEISSQYDDLVNNKGLKVTKITDGTNPYKTSADLFEDVKKNNHMAYFPTEAGYGDGATDVANHPLLKDTKYTTPDGKPMKANDLFRVVHDYYGHVEGENKFGATGEERAFQNHKKMLSPEAQKALASETRGQNSWVNFGPKGAENRANPANTVYAEQKAGLLPDNLATGSLDDIAEPRFAALNKASKLAAKAIAPVGMAAIGASVANDLKDGNSNTAMVRGASAMLPVGTEDVSDKLMMEAQVRDKAPELMDPTYQRTLKNISERRMREGKSPVVESFSGVKVDPTATSDSDVMNSIIKARLQARQG